MSNDDHEDKDDYVVQSVVGKKEERLFLYSKEFEVVASKFWQMMTQSKGTNNSSETLSKQQYVELHSRILKVLAPLYRESEMTQEVLQDWLLDCHGHSELPLNLFQKYLYRIAHQWATSFDLAEYCDLLLQIFDRITCRQVVRANGSVELALPQIQVEISQPKQTEDSEEEEEEESDEAPAAWEECEEGEPEELGFDYKVVEEDGEEFRYKREQREEKEEKKKAPVQEDELKEIFFIARDPFIYVETAKYYFKDASGNQTKELSQQDFDYSILADFNDVVPMGYATEQFIAWIKNDVYKAFIKIKEDRKAAVAAMKRELFDGSGGAGSATQVADRDSGLLQEEYKFVNLHFPMFCSTSQVKIGTFAHVKDNAFNSLRTMLKEATQINLRFAQFKVVSSDLIKRAKDKVSIDSPISKRSAFGYNPCLERRLNYKLAMDQHGNKMFVNVNYLAFDPVFETAYRCDVKRIETSEKMAIKPDESFLRDEEFCNVTTTFTIAKQIMLQKKFESFFTVKLQGDSEKAVERDNEQWKAEKARKAHARIKSSLIAKNMEETFDDMPFLKQMKGPFYQLDSKLGPQHDDFYVMGRKDLIQTANRERMRVIVLGKPRSGKTTVAKELEKRLNLLRVSTDTWINNLFKKIKDREENPPEEEPEPELEEGQERPPKKSWMEPLDEAIFNKLKEGGAPDDEDVEKMLIQLIESPAALTRGFVLDIDFTEEVQNGISWKDRILKNNIIGGENFTHIIQLEMNEDEIIDRSKNMRANIPDGVVYSRYEREERKKPKKVVSEEEEQPEEDEDNAIKPFVENDLAERECDETKFIHKLLENYMNAEQPDFDYYTEKLHNANLIKINAQGLTIDEIAEAITIRIKPNSTEPLTPVATIIEGGSDFKGLLTEGIDPEEGSLPRRWSLWKTVDPVALKSGQVTFGTPEFACHFANNVFVFKDADNLKAFAANPRSFIIESPKMPENYRVMMIGPKGSGTATQARLLSEYYGLKIVDFKKIIDEKLQDILTSSVKLPNNVSNKGPCKICMSSQELQDIKDGKFLPAWKFLPWLMEYLGVPLMQKPPTPADEMKEQDAAEMTEEERKVYEKEQKKKNEEKKKKDKEAEDLAKAKAERAEKRAAARQAGEDLEAAGLQDSEEEIIIPDLSLDQLVPAVNEKGQKPFIGGFILLGFPRTELQINKMKDYGINFDRVIFMNDTTEEPGVEIKKRVMALKNEIGFDWEKEIESVQKVIAAVKEGCGEELVKEINCVGKVEDVNIRILTEIDPFFLLCDNPEENRNTADDVNIDDEVPENTRWLPKSDFGDYCPVSFVKHSFMVRGNKEFESTIQGKTYWFAGEAEQTEFKFNPLRFLKDIKLPLMPPQPKIMIIGQKGAGATTQIAKMCAKYKIENLELAKNYLQTLKSDKELRKRNRLLTRGFRPPPPVEEEGALPEPDAEIEEDPEDFDKANNEKLTMQAILPSSRALVIDGNWTSLPEETVSMPLHELLFESRRTPEVVIVLRCKEETTFKRCIDEKAIKEKYEKIVKDRKEAKEKQRGEDKIQKRKDLIDENKQDPEAEDKKSQEEVDSIVETALAEWEKTRIDEDIQAEEDDPEKPVFNDMVDQEKDRLRELRDKDEAMLNEFVDYLTEKKVKIVDKIQTEVSADYVHIKIVEELKNRMVTRDDLIEREQCSDLKPAEVKHFEKSYTYKHSKFGISSPITPFNPEKSKNFTVLYRERIYFMANEEERYKFKLTPSKYTMSVEPVPLDINVKPAVCVIGLPKSGKTQLCQTLCNRTKAIHLEPESIIEFFIKRDSVFAQGLRQRLFNHGKEIDDSSMLQLICSRIQMRDCQENGWVLEGYPQNRQQAMNFVYKVKPSNVLYLNVPFGEVYKRTASTASTEFSSDRTILVKRLKGLSQTLPSVALFFQKYYNSLTSIDGLKSIWFMEDRALEAITKTIEARLSFSKNYFFKLAKNGQDRSCIMENMNYDRCYAKKTLSTFSYICPVSWKQSKKFVNCCQRPEFTVLYQNQFFYFAGAEQRAIFVQNPNFFTEKLIFSTSRNVPGLLRQHKCSEIIAQEKALMNYCSVTLKDENKVQIGNQLIVVNFKDQRFIFQSQEKALRFIENPARYSAVELPIKMPPAKDKVNLYSLQRKDVSITFMEQALGSVVTRGLREVGENRLKYPTLSVKETMLKLFAIFLKAENPANTEYMREKYRNKMKEFIYKCEVPQELFEMSEDKQEKLKKERAWPEFKEDYFNKLGAKYDSIMSEVVKERATGFSYYIK